MTVVESAWKRYPGYRIDLVPYRGLARVRHGYLVLAESSAAVRVIETDHVVRLYVPESDVRLELFEATDHHTICPFKGEADYWSLTASDPPVENVVWTYRTPFDEVGGLKGYLGFYHERVEVELETSWDGAVPARARNRFPVWGDETDLLGLIDVEPEDTTRFVGAPYHELTRNVVEGGQLLAQAVVAASKANPGQRVTSAFATFPKAASFDAPIQFEVDPLRRGRSFSSLEVRATQNDVLVSPALLLMDAGADELMRSVEPMPDVAGPDEAAPYDMRVSGRALRIVDDAYSSDPDRTGPAEIYAWMRFRDDPEEPYLRQGLLAQATTHWTIAAGMRPHPGMGEALAHVTLSTGIMSVGIAFHDDAPLDGWILYANRALWAGRGLVQGEGRIFTREGTLLASYHVQGMVRPFLRSPEQMGADPSRAM